MSTDQILTATSQISSQSSTTKASSIAAGAHGSISHSPTVIEAISANSNKSIGERENTSGMKDFGKPNHPTSCDAFAVQQLSSKTLRFQLSWFSKFPWLHFSSMTKGVLCFYCSKAEALGSLNLVSKRERVFTVEGYKNWKKAIEKFKAHESTSCHMHALHVIQQGEKNSTSGCTVV